MEEKTSSKKTFIFAGMGIGLGALAFAFGYVKEWLQPSLQPAKTLPPHHLRCHCPACVASDKEQEERTEHQVAEFALQYEDMMRQQGARFRGKYRGRTSEYHQGWIDSRLDLGIKAESERPKPKTIRTIPYWICKHLPVCKDLKEHRHRIGVDAKLEIIQVPTTLTDEQFKAIRDDLKTLKDIPAWTAVKSDHITSVNPK